MAALAFAIVAFLVGCGPDQRQVRLCQRAFAEVEDLPAGFAPAGAAAMPDTSPGVALLFRDARRDINLSFVCRFRGGRFQPGQSELVAVTRLSGEALSDVSMMQLRRRVGRE